MNARPFRPLFVLGLARSGTNLLARMLDRHPAIRVALDPLMPVLRSLRNALTHANAAAEDQAGFRPTLPFQDHYFDRNGPALLDALLSGTAAIPLAAGELDGLRDAVQVRAALEDPALGDALRSIAGSGYRELIRSALRVVQAQRPEATWVGCKEVWMFDFVPALARAFPDARFYAIDRDPRAIVGSLVAMAERDPSQAAHPPSYMRHWRKSVALSLRYRSDQDLAPRFRTIRYEDLVASPEQEARRICGELGLDFDPRMLALSADGWSGNSSFDHGGRDIYDASTDRWRGNLATDVVRTTDYLCGPEMALAGYPADPSAGLDARVLGYLARAGRTPGSWRSDSGDLLFDVSGELLRHSLLGQTGSVDVGMVRRCFLFEETFDAIRHARARPSPKETR